MSIAYQYDANGYFVGAGEDYGYLPNNATYVAAPQAQTGHVLRWNGSAWEQVESHKGEHGYLNGQPHTIINHGPYPDGWSATPPPLTAEELAAAARATRAGLLAASDWTQLPDSPLSGDARAAWAAYRQALRDISDQPGFPQVIDWPEAPA